MESGKYKDLFRRMLIVRQAEEALRKLFADGLVPGFVHLSIGQEAVPVGVSDNLRDTDTVSSNHRGHGHTIAKGVDLKAFFAEVLGRADGLCKGRGGSMHVADLSKGMLGANGIVGAGLPITTGSALALKLRGKGDVAVVYFGDGALAEGLLHECFNIAALWKLPVLFVCENNGWSEFSPTSRQISFTLAALTKAFGMTYEEVDGNKVSEVTRVAGNLISGMRIAAHPVVLECRTTRFRGHFEGDSQNYRDEGELQEIVSRDPLLLAREEMIALGIAALWFDEVETEVGSEVEAALAAALAAPLPAISEITADVYTTAWR
ncbi:Acetoin:2,6-dichlorophenolindophenol oxidoreductase subunit alpha [Hyphomicrobiales bacterium]|nr:Acetoin:2,6-dichlorophenolindophenol oxidoreductase subunit alpha [Hyphomicrobiales bacterium]CAH1692094.1 Acetoin:2,6-dichlorophenolindophenol oxidoreductase subunit alpha [Hyphomicrobiales bacterium]